MRKFEWARNYCAAIAAVFCSGVFGAAPLAAQSLSPGAIESGRDASRINSPSQDFFNRGRRQLEREVRILNSEGGNDSFGGDLLTIDESLKHENWLYPLEETAEPELEVEIRVVPSVQ